jgi:hypothetical protein
LSAQSIALSDQELHDLTGYARPAYQLRVLKGLGIPARKRPDNTVLVMRMDCLQRHTEASNDAPKLKSSKK